MLKTTRKLTNKKDYLKKIGLFKWTNGKRTQIMGWKKKILKYSLFKKMF